MMDMEHFDKRVRALLDQSLDAHPDWGTTCKPGFYMREAENDKSKIEAYLLSKVDSTPVVMATFPRAWLQPRPSSDPS